VCQYEKGIDLHSLILVVIYAVVELVDPVFPLPISIPLVLLIPVVFGLIHGALRLQMERILTFIVILFWSSAISWKTPVF